MKANIRPLFEVNHPRLYAKGQIIIHEGDDLDRLYYVESGFVKMYSIREDGESQILTIYGPDEAFPLSALFDPDAKTASHYFEAVGELQLLYQSRSVLHEKINKNVQSLRVYIQYVVRNSRELTLRLEMLETKNARDKVARILPYLLSKCGRELKSGSWEIALRLTHADIAEMVGITRETASIQIKALEKEGVLSQKGNRWLINRKLLQERYKV